MLRVYHLIIATILLIIIPVGARFAFPNLFINKDTQPNTEATTTKTATPSKPANLKKDNTWQRLLRSTSAPNNWQVLPCQGETALLCVASQGKTLGTVEIDIYPVKDNPQFQKHLTEVGIPPGSQINLQNPQSQSQLVKALQAWVADSYNTFAKNHQAKNADKTTFSTYPPQEVSFGQQPGIRYGFVKLKPEGGVQEQYIGYVTSDGTQLYVINTSFNPSSSKAKFDSLENLAIFQPYLSAIAENLNLSINQTSAQP
ncbi:conserved hypothetical protein [Trichormus variabilis ATCC 29413]|uniref:Uncharacterized protein n=2 Tax=Anabaena variabilis TaxID=264691 RepID=Q3MBN1_TRIV2|nr:MULTISPECIES: hypothetical protein [Nostocaceae]ABA21605.1 conserved hypothetical protein [Trichormus variabilis ATCC 29413]MBC1216120.1 hypothetical protein [Trichormus variabilis ARAD]MBC1255235.1 hypothetical protein [Trichormus variabilis V5]MBC1266198.1 hypothetical protein [Trichormus variabilis FSR]MBC1301657.1 hypothetical protein [Trichormus variabilis N2B]